MKGILTEALDKLTFDAKLNATSWKHNMERSGLLSLNWTLMTPSDDLGQSFHEYCAGFCPSPKPYETSALHSSAQWNVGDVLRCTNGVMEGLCNIANYYRTEEFPPHVVKAGAFDRVGSQEDVILDEGGHKLNRSVSATCQRGRA